MSSSFETGHTKNVATFNSLISFCEAYGSSYNPSFDGIKLSYLQTLAASAQTVLEDCKLKQLDFDQAVDERMQAFAPLRPLSQKMIYALKASGASALNIEGAMTIYRKIQGRRKNSKDIQNEQPAEAGIDPNAQQKKRISVSQVSFDNLLANFNTLVELLSKITSYQPNETELQLSNLKTFVATLKAANEAVIAKYTSWSNVRISRNELLYAKGSGLVDLAGQIKNYVKSIYGLQSPQYKQLAALQFSTGKI